MQPVKSVSLHEKTGPYLALDQIQKKGEKKQDLSLWGENGDGGIKTRTEMERKTCASSTHPLEREPSSRLSSLKRKRPKEGERGREKKRAPLLPETNLRPATGKLKRHVSLFTKPTHSPSRVESGVKGGQGFSGRKRCRKIKIGQGSRQKHDHFQLEGTAIREFLKKEALYVPQSAKNIEESTERKE